MLIRKTRSGTIPILTADESFSISARILGFGKKDITVEVEGVIKKSTRNGTLLYDIRGVLSSFQSTNHSSD